MVRRIVAQWLIIAKKLGSRNFEANTGEQNARQKLVFTAPPQGLYLYNVQYPDLKLKLSL
jgi:tRNA U38,U39,U40 pseudouridine synthase TruA